MLGILGALSAPFSLHAAGLPRYTKALRPEHQAALDKLHEEQRQVDEHLHHRKLDEVRPNIQEHVFHTDTPVGSQLKGQYIPLEQESMVKRFKLSACVTADFQHIPVAERQCVVSRLARREYSRAVF